MPPTTIASPSAFDVPSARARSGRRRSPGTLGAEWRGSSRGTVLGGVLGLALALVPLTGWGAAWAPLAAYTPGWPIVSPLAALALAIAAIGVTVEGSGASRRARRRAAGICGALVLAIAAWAFVQGPSAPPAGGAAALVERWHTEPLLLLDYLPTPVTLGALLFLGGALALLGVGSTAAVRGSWILAAAAALVALLTAGAPGLELEAEATGVLGAVPPAAETIPPPVAFVVLLLAVALLLLPTRDGSWWVPGRRVTGPLTRLLLPGILLLAPAVVWVEELMVRRQLVVTEVGPSLLASALVLGLALLLANAVWRLGRSESQERERDQRRLQRQLEAESEQAALRADQTLRVATDRYRSHLRSILDLAPTPFVAVDRDGYVAYLNGAALTLFDCRPADAAGRPLWDVWPELGAELRGALHATVGGAVIRQTLVSRRTGRTVELRGYPDEAGSALFLREIGA